MRDLMSKPKVVHSTSTGDGSAVKAVGSGTVQVDKEKKLILSFVNDDMCTAILDISFQRMLKKEKASPVMILNLGSLELWSEDFEGKGDFGQYRSKLVYKFLLWSFVLHHN